MQALDHFYAYFVNSTHFVLMAKLFVAMLLGAIIGFERELKHKPVGVKTCVIISITTCILTVVSIQSAEYYAQMSDNIRTDPMRLAAQVISGIGFLGAGVILRKSNDAISGLTTAAIIWAAAGIGIASGAGFFFDAIVATIMILIAIRLSPIIQRLVVRRENRRNQSNRKARLNLTLNSTACLGNITDLLVSNGLAFEQFSVKDQSNGNVKVSFRYPSLDTETAQNLYRLMKAQPDVLSVEVEN